MYLRDYCFISFLFNTVNGISDDLEQEIKSYINRNKNLWREVHDSIRTNDLKQLMTLLSKHNQLE
jgi:hypothetical protein